MRRAREPIVLAVILGLAAWLRLRDVGLMEFKYDEAQAIELARWLLDGSVPSVGLTSSVGAANPPLFVYLTAIPLVAWDDPRAATLFVGLLAVAAVAMTWVVVRPRFGLLAAATSSLLLATAPWAVLAGRKIWAQNMLPPVTVGLLWALFLVLERTRTRAVVLVPVLVCAAFQLNFSSAPLVVPAALVLGYRAREINWRAFTIGVGAALAFLSPWLFHESGNGFDDLAKLATEGRSGGGSSTPGAGTVEAFRQTVDLMGALNWGYLLGPSQAAFTADAGAIDDVARVASLAVAALLVAGLATCIVRIARSTRRVHGPPWVALDDDAARRATLLLWLACLWLAYVVSATGRVFPHYLLVGYPISFLVAALGLSDLAASARLRAVAAAGVVTVAAVYVAFTLSFHHFVGEHGGTAGDYGVIYSDKAALARAMRAGSLRTEDDAGVDFLARNLDAPDPEPPLVTIRDRLTAGEPLACDGRRESFGPLEACFPTSGTAPG